MNAYLTSLILVFICTLLHIATYSIDKYIDRKNPLIISGFILNLVLLSIFISFLIFKKDKIYNNIKMYILVFLILISYMTINLLGDTHLIGDIISLISIAINFIYIYFILIYIYHKF